MPPCEFQRSSLGGRGVLGPVVASTRQRAQAKTAGKSYGVPIHLFCIIPKVQRVYRPERAGIPCGIKLRQHSLPLEGVGQSLICASCTEAIPVAPQTLVLVFYKPIVCMKPKSV